jgi:dihydrofolate synthase/folylpolyglutamate synthase
MQPEAAHSVVASACKAESAKLFTVSEDLVEFGDYDSYCQIFSMGVHKNLKIGMLGKHQIMNAALAVKAIDLIEGFPVSEEALRRGLLEARWPCRFEVVSKSPTIVLDGAHNPHGARSLKRALDRHFPGRKAIFAIGVMADKDYPSMIDEVKSSASRFIAIEPPGSRALGAKELADYIQSNAGVEAKACGSVKEAFEDALGELAEGELVCAFGSLYYIGHAKLVVEKLLSK